MPLQEKQEVLKQWVASGENLKVMETKLVISRSQEGTLTKGGPYDQGDETARLQPETGLDQRHRFLDFVLSCGKKRIDVD